MIAASRVDHFAAVHRRLTALKATDTLFERALLALSLPLFVLFGHRSVGSLPYQFFWIVAYSASFLGILASPRRKELVRRSLPLLGFVALTLISTAWSSTAKVTLIQSVRLIGTTAIAYYLVSRFTLREFVEMFAMAMPALIASSMLFVTVGVECPNAVADASGAIGWCGVFAHKNALGGGMVLGSVTLAVLWFASKGIARWGVFAAFLGCFALLAGSRSATSIVALGVEMACLALMRLGYLRSNGRALIVGGAIVAALAAGIVFVSGVDFDPMLAAIGRDSSLTGRMDFWPGLVQAIRDHPWFGFGYNAFFAYEPGGPADYYLAEYHMTSGWLPPIAHNGLLQVALDVGLVGVALIGYALVVAFKGAFATIGRHRHDSIYMWPALVLIYFVLVNITESDIAQYQELFWIVLVAAILYASVPQVCNHDVSPEAPEVPRGARRHLDHANP